MLRKIIAIAPLLFLAACKAPPLPTDTMLPSGKIISELPKDYYLKNKLAIGSVANTVQRPNLEHMFENFQAALQSGLTDAGMLTEDPAKAKYALLSDVKDIASPSCAFGTCETGSTVNYTLLSTATGKPVYSELVVVPYTFEYPMFGSNMNVEIIRTQGGAMGENITHIAQSLARKTPQDLK